MDRFGRIIGAGLLLALAAPAFCDAPAGLIGQWQDPNPLPAGEHGSRMIQEFRVDGTEHALTQIDGKLQPVHQKDGTELVVKYTIKGNQMVFTSLDGKHSEQHPFQLDADTLTFLPSGKYRTAAVLKRLSAPAAAAAPASPTPPTPGN